MSRWSHITCQLNIPAVLMRYFFGCSVERGFISLDYAIPRGHRYKCFKAYENNFKVYLVLATANILSHHELRHTHSFYWMKFYNVQFFL